MAESEVPSYDKKRFVELDSQTLPRLADALHNGGSSYAFSDVKLSDIANNRFGATSNAKSAAAYFTSIGLGDYTAGQVNSNLKNADFIAQFAPLGKSLSYTDLAREALQSDPNFDPEDTQSLSAFAQDLEKRGLDNTKRDKIASLATGQGINNQIDKAVNPGKYLSAEKVAENTAIAQRLLKTTFGDGYEDPDFQQFLTDRLAEGESAFEVSQFLQTTPQYMEKKSLAENERVKTESAAARESLNQELLRSQQEVFARAQPSIISSYMRAGRLNSSGLQSALAQAQADLEKERQGFLANAGYNDAIRAQGYGREDFVANNAQAFNSYLRQNEPAYQQRFAVNQAQNFANYQQPYNNLNRQYQLSDEARQRQYQIEDYDRQQSDYNRYMSQANKQSRESALYGLLGSAIGGGIQGWAMRK